MTQTTQTILEKFQQRKTKKQKQEFIDYMKSEFPHLSVEESKGLIKNKNLVIGDVYTADFVLTAHYDTCATLPFPNFIAPKNFVALILYQIFTAIILVGPAFLLVNVLAWFDAEPLLVFVILYLYLIFILWFIMAGKPNKTNINDNTSGVVTLIELMNRMDEETLKRTAFVFFDNEELGLIGSSKFKSKYKNIMKNKLLINFDCVSDGDNILYVFNKKARKKFQETAEKSFVSTAEKNVLLEKSSNTFYPSDQVHFPVSIGVAALKKKKFIGYYMDKIHTKHDTVFDERNINFICDSIIKFTQYS